VDAILRQKKLDSHPMSKPDVSRIDHNTHASLPKHALDDVLSK